MIIIILINGLPHSAQMRTYETINIIDALAHAALQDQYVI